MPVRRRWLTVIQISALLLLPATALAQQEPATAEEVVSKYMQAIGADRFSSITSFMEIGDLDGNLTNWWAFHSPSQAVSKQHGTFEYYYKSPNLRFDSRLTENNLVIGARGCDGKVSWYIDSFLKRTEMKPKPESKYECEAGLQSPLSRLQKPNVKMRLLKKKEIDGRMAWEIKVQFPKVPDAETFYFDSETFLLLRSDYVGSKVTYSDYRDLDGMKFPFKITTEFNNSKLLMTAREMKINSPIDDARFAEPQVKGRALTLNSGAPSTSQSAAVASTPSAIAPSTNGETTSVPSSDSYAAPTADSIVEVNYPNFTSCPLADLQQTVPELKGLKPAADQEGLSNLLDRVGAKTVDIARNTPNLISRETVTERPQGPAASRRDYDYLILAHIEEKTVELDEFRVDLKSGEKFQTDEILKKGSPARAELERTSQQLGKAGHAPMSQGFATSWVHFYPANRKTETYRFLGEQKMEGQRTMVLAFAQQPALVLSPAMVEHEGKMVPMYFQGVAWVDASDFRILRLRTDLLTPLPEVFLHRLTAEIQFGLTRIESVASPVPLPHEVMLTSTVGGSTVQELHKYSGYRLFRAKSKILLPP